MTVEIPGKSEDYPDASLENTVPRAFKVWEILLKNGVDCKIDAIQSPNIVILRVFELSETSQDQAEAGTE